VLYDRAQPMEKKVYKFSFYKNNILGGAPLTIYIFFFRIFIAKFNEFKFDDKVGQCSQVVC
jgi:hypothetical protein